MDKTMERTYRTKDLATAGIILARKIKLASVERINGVCWFVFEDNETCEEISHDFWFSECLINAKDFYDALVTLKTLIFSEP